jgi:predicted O-methyltransferase YrrM
VNTYLAKKYLEYKLKAKDEHSIHSPFVFDLYCSIIKATENYYVFDRLKAIRSALLQDKTELQIEDFGAGSKHFKDGKRSVQSIARHGITPENYSKLLFRLVEAFKCEYILELGTSLGLNTLYLAAPSSQTQVSTFEGSGALCEFSKKLFAREKFRNIKIIAGNFDDTFDPGLKKIPRVDLLFIDGNHRFEPTLNYFLAAVPKIHNDSIVVLDDIYWSDEMQQAWQKIKQHESVRCTIDLFQFGLIFFRKEFMEREHFILKF